MTLTQSTFLPKIIYQDNDIVIANKPSNLLCVPGRGIDKQDCLLTRLQQVFPQLLVVHRLDMATSGLIIFARHKNAQSLISQMFAKRQIYKTYYAIVIGWLTKPSGTIDLPLIVDWNNRPKQKVDFNTGKPSITNWKLIDKLQLNNTNCSYLKLMPITGRSHQLRLHLASIGHSILGDNLYATSSIAQLTPRLMLHAQQLDFIQPISKQRLTIKIADDFAAVIKTKIALT